MKNLKLVMQTLWMKISVLAATLLLAGCSIEKSESFNDSQSLSNGGNLVLYVASGACYGGGVSTSAGSGMISAFDQNTGRLKHVLIDYNSFSPGDLPISIVEYDKDSLLVLVENSSGRRIDLLSKDGSNVRTYLTNSTAFATGAATAVRKMLMVSDNSLLVSKSTAIEKFSSAKARITQGANPYVSAPGSSCATTTTLISGMATLPNGKILYTHAAATPNNKIAVISSTGYAATSDCLATQAAPTTTALPTSILVHSSGKVLVAYGSTTAASNFIYSYDFDSATNTFSNPIVAYNNIAVINGPSAMTEDPLSGDILVANANSGFNTVERFSFNAINGLMTRVQSQSLISQQIYTRCVSDMKVLSQ